MLHAMMDPAEKPMKVPEHVTVLGANGHATMTHSEVIVEVGQLTKKTAGKRVVSKEKVYTLSVQDKTEAVFHVYYSRPVATGSKLVEAETYSFESPCT